MRNHKKTDREVQEAVLKELTWDTRVAPTEVGVRSTVGSSR